MANRAIGWHDRADLFNGTSFVMRLAVAPGGRLVAATVEGDVLVYDLETRAGTPQPERYTGIYRGFRRWGRVGRDGDGSGSFRHPLRRG